MDERGMKWYRFLVTAGLMIGALVNALNGASFVTGRIYNTPYTTATEVYGDYPLLKICDVVYGALLIGLALYEVHARQRLLQFRRNGPETYYIFVIANVVISMIFIVASVVIGLIYGLNISFDYLF